MLEFADDDVAAVVVPAPARCELDLSADELLRALLRLEAHRSVAILDSGGARSDAARYLIAGFDPREIVEARANETHIKRRDKQSGAPGTAPRDVTTTATTTTLDVTSGSLLELLDALLAHYHRVLRPSAASSGVGLRIGGACIATLSYDFAARRLHPSRLISHGTHSDVEPEAVFAFYDALVIHDYACNRTEVTSVAGPERLLQTCDTLRDYAARDHAFVVEPVGGNPNVATSNFTRNEYTAAVRAIKERIYAGDIYQANLTQQFRCALAPTDTPERLFLRLRRANPAAFAAFIRRANDAVVSCSPERFLRVGFNEQGARTVEAWPIKGTRARGANADQDEALRRELQESAKDRAENVMIVDLMRNDLGRVCRYGSIEVAELCRIEEHPTLFHLVSKVRGVLRDDVTVGQLLEATFPAGSITGAPKLRAMEIINDIETAPRGLSMGAIGYFSFDGSLDLNVAIRTITVRDNRLRPPTARFNVGGGIVAGSCPELEYEESLLKAKALLRALKSC